MTDQQIQTVLLSLLRSGLWASSKSDGLAALSPAEWNALYTYAQQHTIEGIVFDGLQRMPADLLPPRALLLKWAARLDQIERHNRKMAALIKDQLEQFELAGIRAVLLKGLGVAACYEVPEHRISGDVDWYFAGGRAFRKANAMMEKQGVSLLHTAGLSAEYCWQGIVVEHHQRMFDIHNPFCFSYLNRLQEQYPFETLKQDFAGLTLTLPSPILMMLQVNAHILKHLLSFGLGIRQLCDAARVYHTYRNAVDGKTLEAIYHRLGILPWIHLLHAVLLKYIGLPAASLPFPIPEGTDADWMMQEVWRSGNFGFFDERFEGAQAQVKGERKQAGRRILSNVKRYFRYAPMEALSFPVVQFISKYSHLKL